MWIGPCATKPKKLSDRYSFKALSNLEHVWYDAEDGRIIARIKCEGNTAWHAEYGDQYVGEYVSQQHAINAVEYYKVKVYK